MDLQLARHGRALLSEHSLQQGKQGGAVSGELHKLLVMAAQPHVRVMPCQKVVYGRHPPTGPRIACQGNSPAAFWMLPQRRGGCLSTVCALYRLNLRQELCRLSVVVGTQAEEYVY